MKLLVRVIEAKNLPPMESNGFTNPYVKLQLGRQSFRSKAVKKCLNPSWSEEFIFKVDDLKRKLVVSVLDEEKCFNYDFVGQIKVPVTWVFEAKDQSLGTAWYTLDSKSKNAKNKECGEILLNISLLQKNTWLELPSTSDPIMSSKKYAESQHDSLSRSSSVESSPSRFEEEFLSKEEKINAPTLAGRIAKIFNKNIDTTSISSIEASDASETESVDSVSLEHKFVEPSSSVDFEELIRSLEMKEQSGDVPNCLPGGVVLDQIYAIAPHELNSLLFSPDSNFFKSSADMQGSTDLQVRAWEFETNGESLKRVVSYTKPPTKLVKALKATEEQTYLKAKGGTFAVLAIVGTPDAPYGKTFKAEVLYCITPGPEQPSGEQSSQLVISWRINFSQSTMMKGMIESGARQGIKESFDQYEKLLSRHVKPLDLKDMGSEKDQLLASLQVEHHSEWKLAVQYFANIPVILAIFTGLYVLTHLWMAMPSKIQGLEFVGLDLPDSIGELIVCTLLVLQGKHVLKLVSRFMQARVQKGSDHGIKGKGDGWLLTVALIEGSHLAATNLAGSSDPYVVFTCNGKRKTSSIKFQKSEPLWNEIFEFDAMNEPPSRLDVDVFDFDGPFVEPLSLGQYEINFLKSSISDLSDVWIPLQGKLAQACQSKLHLRIFLSSSKASNVVQDYIAKLEKEVGKKIRLRSPQTNSAFQKLFELPPEEFLINDFTCYLRRKMPLQGRLFLSARTVGFHADLFGQKTKFFFLWEDVEDIQRIPPTLSSMGSPVINMLLHHGRGTDARHGARSLDAKGRLAFHFHSFVSFNVALRTIMAVWRARALPPKEKVLIAEKESEANDVRASEEESASEVLQTAEEEIEINSDDSDAKSFQTEESGSFLGVDDVNMSMVYSSMLPLSTSFCMELFSGSDIDERVMERAGCLNYTHSPWESEKPDVYQRQLYYKLEKCIPLYRGEVTSTQQKFRLSVRNGWVIEEVMNLQGVPLGDNFTLHLRYQIEDLPATSAGCSVQVYLGIAWVKYTRNQKRITKNIMSILKKRVKLIFSMLEKEHVSKS
ncbi:C2 calcium/lipid-binding and GRAM domain containing protein [Perilla frutescens var. hirtella]|uniref:C2 calcium/lipid-binding and GRAM domain containing protein n=1 Tax=Perilla frutescens var. hirtella TaxID=608512 RepID=A0AAD4J345_PERFH|nr:C2 calcium/lipid-binding and GRAM domain containing protein [Perilla frutescens var. hirtella]